MTIKTALLVQKTKTSLVTDILPNISFFLRNKLHSFKISRKLQIYFISKVNYSFKPYKYELYFFNIIDIFHIIIINSIYYIIYIYINTVISFSPDFIFIFIVLRLISDSKYFFVFPDSMDVQGDYDPCDASGFIKINAVR